MRRNVTGIFLVEMFGMTFEIEYENMYDARIPFNLLPLEHLELRIKKNSLDFCLAFVIIK